MVRSGTEKDIESIVSMAGEFWGHTIYDEPVCPDTIEGMARACMDQGLMSVLEIKDKIVGFACGVKGVLLGNNSVSTGTEIAWWVNPENRGGKNGISLLKHIEKLARKEGIKYWNMAFMMSSMPEEVEGIYVALGYAKTEVIYSKVLEN